MRVALGSTASGVLGLVLVESARIAVAGVLLGIPAAVALATLVRSRLYGISAIDPLTLASAATLMLAVAALAGFIPAWRAAAIDPALALRAE